MKLSNEICPLCKKLNANLDLEETDGLYECIGCGKVNRVEGISRRGAWIPIYTPEELVKKLSNGPSFAEAVAKL